MIVVAVVINFRACKTYAKYFRKWKIFGLKKSKQQITIFRAIVIGHMGPTYGGGGGGVRDIDELRRRRRGWMGELAMKQANLPSRHLTLGPRQDTRHDDEHRLLCRPFYIYKSLPLKLETNSVHGIPTELHPLR